MDLYEILSISTDATSTEITKAYRHLAKKYHPDKETGSTEQFQKLNYAYNILVNEKTRIQYDSMKKPTKNKLTKFLEEWFDKQVNIKDFINLSGTKLENIMNNIESYDFTDIIGLFNKMIIPNKQNNNTIDCSDSDISYWDQDSAEYYNINELPLKYHLYNINNIKIDLKCTLDDIKKNDYIRKIKVKRKQNNSFIETSFYFKCSHSYIIFNNGGDNDGHLIINLSLHEPYIWYSDSIYYNININLYEYIYGIDIPKFNIKNWIPYKDGTIINLNYINNYLFGIKINIIYNDNNNNKEMLKKIIH
jgi:DnaJ-class molecular chaperone